MLVRAVTVEIGKMSARLVERSGISHAMGLNSYSRVTWQQFTLETRNSRSKQRGDPHGQDSSAGSNIPKSKLEPGQSHSPSRLKSQVSDPEISEGLAGTPAQ